MLAAFASRLIGCDLTNEHVEMTVETFFSGYPMAKSLFEPIAQEVQALGGVQVRVTKSQIAFHRQRNFAWVWRPGQYLKGKVAPLVLTVSLPARDLSSRWKEIVEPAPGRFIHHLELFDRAGIDEQVRVWLKQAWDAAK